jgi:hypothetical protein
MLYWICPECGHECSPAIRECPTCTAAEKTTPSEQSSADILSLAESFPSATSVGLLNTASYRNLTSAAHGHSTSGGAAILVDEDTVELVLSPTDRAAIAYQEPAPSSELAPLDILAVKPSSPAISELAKPAVSPTAPRVPAPALVAAKIPQSEYSLKPARLAPTSDIAFQAFPGRELPTAREQEAEPAPSRRRSVAFLRGALPGADTSEIAPADLAQPGRVWLTAAAPAASSGNETSAIPLDPKAGSLAFISSKVALAGASLVELLHALRTTAEELERSAIRAIQTSFEEQPTAPLLCAPREIVTAPAPPAEQWLRSPQPVFAPKAPANVGLATLIAGPQTPTLAGPHLPPQLRNFIENHSSNLRRARKRAPAPTWMISVLVAMILFLALGSLLQYLTTNRDANAASVSPAPPRTSAPAPAPAPPVAREHPDARFVEVAGVRVVAAANKRPQLQYIVINHAANELTGLNIHMAVHSADSPTGPPLFTVSSVVPSLAANQSREIRTDLDAGIKAASLPDWQSLRTEILIARQ